MLVKKLILTKNNLEILKILFVNNQKILLYGDSKMYLVIPKEIKIFKRDNAILLQICNKYYKNLLKVTFNYFLKFLKNYGKTYRKAFVLKGLGLKVFLFKNRRRVRFKLGLSHLISINIPQRLKIFRNKKKTGLLIESSDSVLLGNFSHVIKSLKKPNSYNGKGITCKGDSFVSKPFKKK